MYKMNVFLLLHELMKLKVGILLFMFFFFFLLNIPS